MLTLKSLRKHSVAVVLAYDICAVIVSWWIAFLVRYNFSTASFSAIQHELQIQIIVTAVHVFFYWRYKTYRPLWRFFFITRGSTSFQGGVLWLACKYSHSFNAA